MSKGDLTEQADEEYWRECGRPMVSEGPLRHVLRVHRIPRLQDHQAIGGQQKKPDQPLEEKCRSAATNWR